MGSRVSQIFGASPQKKEEQLSAPNKIDKQEEERNKKIQEEKITNHLNTNAEIFRNKEMKYEAKINNLKSKAKEHLENGKQKQAKKLLQEVTRMNKQLQRVEVRRRLIESQAEHVQTHSLNREVIDAIEQAHQLTKEDFTSKLEDHIITAKENQILQDQINENLKQIVQDSEAEEEVDQLFRQLEDELQKESKTKILNKRVKVVDTQKIQSNKQQTVKQVNQFQKMMAEL